MLPQPATLSAEALSRMLQVQGLNQPHLVLRPDPVWQDPAGNHGADTSTWTEFADAGLLDTGNRLDSGARDTLRALAQPHTEYYAFYAHRGQLHIVLIAEGHGQAVLAHRDGDTITLNNIGDHCLPETLIRQLPATPPARITAINVHLDDLAGGPPDDIDTVTGDARPLALQDAAALAQLARRPVLGQGSARANCMSRYTTAWAATTALPTPSATKTAATAAPWLCSPPTTSASPPRRRHCSPPGCARPATTSHANSEHVVRHRYSLEKHHRPPWKSVAALR